MDIKRTARKIKIVGGITVFFGLLTAISAAPQLTALYEIFADLVIWPAEDTYRPLSAETRLTQAIMGGIFTGFGVMWLIASGTLLEKAPTETLRLLFLGASTWFVTDSSASIIAGAAANVPPNIAFFLVMLWALKTPKNT
ncbi:MAG: hypothetical protein AAF700_09200 [Pseudomonadota bacterium]